jgi:hypothetical protein
MVRKCSMFLAVLAALLVAPLALPAQTVDDVIAKNVQAVGGMDKLKAVHSVRVSGKLQVQGFEAQFVQMGKRGDKIREEFVVQRMAQIQAYDGRAGWSINPFSGRRDPELMSQDDTKGLQVDADIDGPLVDYKAKGHTAELIGHDSVEGTDCYKIKLTLKNGDVRYYYLDTDSFLPLKLETQTTIRGTIQESETYYGDYEQVNGVYYSFAFESGQKGDTNRAKFTIDKIEQNIPLDDTLFSMPATKAAPKPSGGN